MDKPTQALAARMEQLLREAPDPQASMRYAEERLYEAGLLAVLGVIDLEDPTQHAQDLLGENPLIPDYLRLQEPPINPEAMESPEEIVETLTARVPD